MKYALNLAEDGRILSATYEQYAPIGSVIVDELPEGDIFDYRYVDGQYAYDPLPEPEQPKVTATHNILAGEYVTINGVMYKATCTIPRGEQIVVNHNAVVTTVEEQLSELMKGE